MYGIVNKAIEELVVDQFGEEKWNTIKENSGIDVDFFISNEPYDDEITYTLATSVAEEMNISVGDVLKAFGEWWILKTGKEKYGYLLESGGDSFKDFIINLPNFHNRVMLMYPKLTPPEFKVDQIEAKSIHLHYISARKGLQDFVYGLIMGLGKFFDTEVKMKHVRTEPMEKTHEVYKITWE